MNAKELLETMADLESRIAVLYERLATRFRGVADVSDLWESMGREELHHADLLSRAASDVHDDDIAAEVVDHLRALEARVGQYERDQTNVLRLQDALRVTVDLEEAEAEHLHAVLQAMGGSLRSVAEDPGMRHRLRGLLERAIELFGTPELQRRTPWRRFAE